MARNKLCRYWLCLLVLVVFIWLEINYGLLCSRSLSDDLQTSDYKDMVQGKDLEIHQLQKKLNNLQESLSKKFPVHAKLLRHENSQDYPWIYIITPTHTREVQKAELTRIGNTFLNVPNLHWIVIEDNPSKTDLVANFLAASGLSYTHLYVPTPPSYKMKENDPNWLKPRGVLQRNRGLEWIRTNVDPKKRKGVLYFADDDNTYDLKVFEEMRFTNKVSVWPVGLVGKLRYETPIVKNGHVTGWYTYWKPQRPFAMDMAGFAINIRLLFKYPEVQFSLEVPRGYQESAILKNMVTLDELEPKANNCTKILVWHTRTEKADLRNEEKLRKKGLSSDPFIEV